MLKMLIRVLLAKNNRNLLNFMKMLSKEKIDIRKYIKLVLIKSAHFNQNL